MTEPAPKGGSTGQTMAASVGALISLIAASSCCLPLFPFVAAAGLAGFSTMLASLRPFLLLGAVCFVGYGLYQGWRAKQCHRTPNKISSVLLWFSAALVAVSIVFPQLVANLLAGR